MKCDSNIETNLYHILVYDVENDGTPFIEKPAYETSTMITVMSSKITNVVTQASQTTSPNGGKYCIVVIILMYTFPIR